MVQDAEKIILSRNEEQSLKNLAKWSDEDDYESSGQEENDGKRSSLGMRLDRRVT